MKLLSFILAFCLTANVLAASGTTSELERSIDDYQYTLTVEWNQKDKKFYDEQTDAFLAKIAQIIKKEGLTKDQVLALADKKVQDKKTLDAMKLKMSLLKKDMSSEELAATLKDSVKDFYAQGASWNGRVLAAIPIAAVVLVIGYVIYWHSTHECVEYEEQYQCHTYNDCIDYGFDDYGHNNCSLYRQETRCGYVDVCTDYAKK
jgi:hypothetical protein